MISSASGRSKRAACLPTKAKKDNNCKQGRSHGNQDSSRIPRYANTWQGARGAARRGAVPCRSYGGDRAVPQLQRRSHQRWRTRRGRGAAGYSREPHLPHRRPRRTRHDGSMTGVEGTEGTGRYGRKYRGWKTARSLWVGGKKDTGRRDGATRSGAPGSPTRTRGAEGRTRGCTAPFSFAPGHRGTGASGTVLCTLQVHSLEHGSPSFAGSRRSEKYSSCSGTSNETRPALRGRQLGLGVSGLDFPRPSAFLIQEPQGRFPTFSSSFPCSPDVRSGDDFSQLHDCKA